MDQKILQYEQAKFREAQQLIIDEMSKLRDRINWSDDSIKDLLDYVHTQKIDDIELIEAYESINLADFNSSVLKKELMFYKRILKKPFFARLDIERNNDSNIFYVGLKNISKDIEPMVVDWRTPIASLLYYADLGKTQYTAPMGQIEVNLLLKRQFSIASNNINYYVDSGVKINDDILLETLANNTSNYMTNIVATIQKEQNEIIRRSPGVDVIIDGVAGSGKTSIALHRLAYILYAKKDQITSKNIIMISPNNMFDKYVSELLPELGEENVASYTLDNFFKHMGIFPANMQSKAQMVENLFYDTTKQNEINIKRSLDFFNFVNDYLKNIDTSKLLKEIDWGGINITTADLSKLKNRYRAENLYEHIEDDIRYLLSNKFSVLTDKKIDNLVNKQMKKVSKFLQPTAFIETIYKEYGLAVPKKLGYEDLGLYAYLSTNLQKIEKNYWTKYIYVDEMQDYDNFSIAVMKSLFPDAKFILCGDYSQNIVSTQSNLDYLKQCFPDISVDKLSTSYRSTANITQFAQQIINVQNSSQIIREGSPTQVIECDTETKQWEYIQKYSKLYPKEKIAIIAKTENDARKIALNCPQFDLIVDDNNPLQIESKKIITTINLSKGLEYDRVIIPLADANHYNSSLDQQNLYVASTRALHHLTCLFSGKVSNFIPQKYITKTDSEKRIKPIKSCKENEKIK